MQQSSIAHNTNKETYLLAFFAAMLGFLCFSLMDSIVRHLGTTFTLPAMYFGFLQRLFSSTVLFIVIITISIKKKSWDIFKIQYPLSHIIRGIFVFTITISFTLTFTLLPLSNAYSVIFSLPLFTALVARITIKEKISKIQLIGILGGFIGILIILRPGLNNFSVGYLFALLGVGIEAPLFTMIRHYHKKDHPLNISFYSSVVALALFYIYELFRNTGATVSLEWSLFGFLILFAIISVCNQFFLFYSLKYLKAGLSLSMQFSQIIWGALFGYLFFKDNEYDLYYFIGIVIIIFFSIVVSSNHMPFFRIRK